MGLLSDLVKAVEAYPHEYLTIEIVDIDPAVGDTINEDEDVSFDIQISNSGPLDVQRLELKVEGLNGTQVKQSGAAAQFVPFFTTTPGYLPDVRAHSANEPPVVYINAHFTRSAPTSGAKDLVRVSVFNWTSNSEHIFAHGKADPLAEAIFTSAVAQQ
jgi:hypothetical protein